MKKIHKDVAFYFLIISGYLTFSVLLGNIYMNVSRRVCAKPGRGFDTVVIDPGHGGEDSGAVSDSGVFEKDINLDIAQKLKSMLVSSGVKVIMTRQEDCAIYDEKNTESLRGKKVSDMKNRLEIINSNPNSILVSIHQNKFTDKKYYGTQVFYSQNNSSSLNLAENIRNSFKQLIQPDNERETKPAGKEIYILHNAKVPAVIVECGFVSNDEELSKLLDEDYKLKVAFSIYCGILNSSLLKN